MNTFFQDEFVNNYALAHLIREIKQDQLMKTIREISILNDKQEKIVSRKEVPNYYNKYR